VKKLPDGLRFARLDRDIIVAAADVLRRTTCTPRLCSRPASVRPWPGGLTAHNCLLADSLGGFEMLARVNAKPRQRRTRLSKGGFGERRTTSNRSTRSAAAALRATAGRVRPLSRSGLADRFSHGGPPVADALGLKPICTMTGGVRENVRRLTCDLFYGRRQLAGS